MNTLRVYTDDEYRNAALGMFYLKCKKPVELTSEEILEDILG